MIDLVNADFRENELPDGMFDYVLTDPPYPKKYWHLISDLGREAYRLTKDDAFLTVVCGNYCPAEWSWRLIQEGWILRWTGWLAHSGRVGVRPEIRMRPRGKPILHLSKHWKTKPKRTMDDVVVGGGQEKSHHPWQQDRASSEYLIEGFTEPGEYVLDPFAGSATVLAAAFRLRRKAVGFEVDPEHFNQAIDRMECEV